MIASFVVEDSATSMRQPPTSQRIAQANSKLGGAAAYVFRFERVVLWSTAFASGLTIAWL